MVRVAKNALDEVDVIIFIVDVYQGIGGGDRFIAEELRQIKTPVVLAANKIDKVGKLKKLKGRLRSFSSKWSSMI